MQNRLRLGVLLIAIGILGLLILSGLSWGWGGTDWWRWHHGPLMRGEVLPPIAGARTIDIVAGDFSFKPAEITIKAGEVVNLKLVNQGVTVHDLVVPAQGIWMVVPPEQSTTSGFRSDLQGEYQFFCSVPGHREAGMVGRIVVSP
ncbi:MAG: cupredoxin domain-containing protein [Armatimonadota bacterium]